MRVEKKKSLQVLLFDTLNLLKFQMLLMYVLEDFSFHGHVVWGICTKGAQLWWPTWKTGFTWKSEELYTFCGHVKCPGLLSNGVILLCDKAWPHKAQQARNLPQNFSWKMLDCPSLSVELTSSNFELFSTLKEYLFHLWWIVDCAVFTCVTQHSMHLGWA